MNATTAILERVRSVDKIDRDALIAEMERDFDAKLVSSSVSTMIRRGELQELETGEIALGDEDAIARAREEREQRKRDRDRPSMPPPSPTAHVAPVAATPRPGSHTSAVTICAKLQEIVDQHGPLRATDIGRRSGQGPGSSLYYHLNAMVERGELFKRGALYATSPVKPEASSSASLDVDATAPTAPVIDVAAAVAEAVRESTAQPQKPAPARVKTIADVARKHTAATPEEHVLQLGDVYIAVTAPAPVATRVLSAALAVLGTQP